MKELSPSFQVQVLCLDLQYKPSFNEDKTKCRITYLDGFYEEVVVWDGPVDGAIEHLKPIKSLNDKINKLELEGLE